MGPIKCKVWDTPDPGLDFKLVLEVLDGNDIGTSIVRAPLKCKIIDVDQHSHGATINLQLDCGLIVTLGFPFLGNLQQEPENLSSLVNNNTLERGDQIMKLSTPFGSIASIFHTVVFTINWSDRILSIEYLKKKTKTTTDIYELVIVNMRSTQEAGFGVELPSDVKNTVSNRRDLGHWFPNNPTEH